MKHVVHSFASRLSPGTIIYGVHANFKVLFGNRVRELRAKLGVSQEDLADIAGLHRTYMGSVERGERNISLENILKIARALRVPPKELLSKFK
jgi:transcriptional regulator with XRE-family HTH domain